MNPWDALWQALYEVIGSTLLLLGCVGGGIALWHFLVTKPAQRRLALRRRERQANARQRQSAIEKGYRNWTR